MDDGFKKEERLIELVREKPYLYDKKNKSYKDVSKKNNAFDEIGTQLGLSGKETKDLWEKLRKQYTNYLSKLKNPSGSGAGNPPFFRHSGTMQFYQGVYKPYKSSSNINDDDGFEHQEYIDEEDDVVINDPLQASTSENIQVDYEGFNGVDTPPVVIHHQQTGSTPTASKSRGSKKRCLNTDDFNERFFAAIEKTSEIKGDEFDHFGANIAARLRKVSSKKPRLGAKLQLELQTLITNYELKLFPEESASGDSFDED